MEVFKNNPHITRLIQHKEETPTEHLADNIKWVKRKFKCEKVLDFSESIEVALSQHPRSPNYKLPKQERIARFNRNFYEYAFEHVGESWVSLDLKPELFFEPHEIRDVKKHLRPDCYNVLMGLSGSGNNKTWPWGQDFAYRLCDDYPDVHLITVGDLKCQIIEPERKDRITNLSGRISMREAMALTSVVDLVIAPDTGITHAAGCFDTPQIIMLGHNTHECISKHFTNAYPIEADSKLAPCAPCLFLIYDHKLQCPLNPETHSSICMADGISLQTVYNKFAHVKSQKRS